VGWEGRRRCGFRRVASPKSGAGSALLVANEANWLNIIYYETEVPAKTPSSPSVARACGVTEDSGLVIRCAELTHSASYAWKVILPECLPQELDPLYLHQGVA
jgi:hypothetical protein